MNKKKDVFSIVYIAVVILITVIICGLLIARFLYYGYYNKNKIMIVNDNGSSEFIMDFDDFKPGMKKESKLKIKTKEKGIYSVTLEFIEVEEGDLKKYLDVFIIVDDEVIINSSLEEILNSNNLISFKKEIDSSIDLKVVYEMPKDIGNEAQNTNNRINIKVNAMLEE